MHGWRTCTDCCRCCGHRVLPHRVVSLSSCSRCRQCVGPASYCCHPHCRCCRLLGVTGSFLEWGCLLLLVVVGKPWWCSEGTGCWSLAAGRCSCWHWSGHPGCSLRVGPSWCLQWAQQCRAGSQTAGKTHTLLSTCRSKHAALPHATLTEQTTPP